MHAYTCPHINIFCTHAYTGTPLSVCRDSEYGLLCVLSLVEELLRLQHKLTSVEGQLRTVNEVSRHGSSVPSMCWDLLL